MEKVDVLSKDGSDAWYSVTREEAHKKGLWHRTVHVWIINSKGMILIQKRAPTKETHPGKWDVSCAGHLSAGDKSVQGAIRELKEELGISVNKNELNYLFTIPQTTIVDQLNIIDNEFSDVYLLRKDLIPKNLSIQIQELTKIKFIKLDELKHRVLISHDPDFAPHEDEYLKIFQILESR
jgi:isopentenyl-diphosphate Delta-isomerase